MATSGQASLASTKAVQIRTLVIVFVLWKLLLLCVASASPGIGYDTSTRLLLPSMNSSVPVTVLQHVSSRLVRWDALYFLRIAERGCLFEQEWAFNSGFVRLVAYVARVIIPGSLTLPLLKEAIAGIIVAHVSHLLSVIFLFALTLSILPAQHPQQVTTAFIAAVLHIISPAGIFLSAPYSESLFSCLSFLGMLLYSQSYQPPSGNRSTIYATLAILGSGLCWGLASSVRSNGLLSGIVLAYRCLMLVMSPLSLAALQMLAATIAAGLLVALGSVVPQWFAYQEYCLGITAEQSPTWCSRVPPSVYTWVQEHYWNVGFLRYWTLSNAPLFLLAIPVLFLMLSTALIAIYEPRILLLQEPSGSHASTKPQGISTVSRDEQRFIACMRSFALPQAVLAVLTLTNFHVQIINRISSGYSVWYIVLAMAFTSRNSTSATSRPSTPSEKYSIVGTLASTFRNRGVQKSFFGGMILYAIIQCGLYASFLPPA